MFKKIFLTKCNYEIYNKKLLTIVKIFKKYCLNYLSILINFLIKIFIDYKNLKYFIIFKQLN